jgi:hypothetical protein
VAESFLSEFDRLEAKLGKALREQMFIDEAHREMDEFLGHNRHAIRKVIEAAQSVRDVPHAYTCPVERGEGDCRCGTYEFVDALAELEDGE